MGVKDVSIAKKYIFYSGISGLIGIILGFFGGVYLFPKVLIRMYSPPYILKEYPIVVYWDKVMYSFLIGILVILIIPFFSYHKVLNENALELLRPKKVREGKRSFVENSKLIWNKLPFVIKMGIRNLKFYKFRMFFILVGLTGCLSLLITGYGARNSVSQMQQQQFRELQKYSTVIGATYNIANDEKEELEIKLNEKYGYFLANQQENAKVTLLNNKDANISIFSPINNEEKNNLTDYFKLIDYESGKKITFKDEDVAITNKLATLLETKPDEMIKIKLSDNSIKNLKITYIVKNHYEHLIFVGQDPFKEIDKKNTVDTYWINSKDTNEEERKEILELPGVVSIFTREQALQKMDLMTEQLDGLIIVVIIASILLGIIVIYDLAYLSILERKQEIAVLETIGKNPLSVSMHLFKELFFLLFLTLIIGTYAGLKLHEIIMKQIELDFLSFPEIDTSKVLLQSIISIFMVFLIVLFFLHQVVKRINIIESLKERE